MIRLSSIGDIVHTLPAVAALGAAHPEAEIHWAVEARYAVLVEGNPFVERILPFDTLGWRRRLGSVATVKEATRKVLDLRDQEYQVAIDFQGLVKTGFLARLSGAGDRLGLAERWLREPLAALWYTDRVPASGRVHAIEEGLALVERLGAPRLERAQWQFPLPRTVEDDRAVEERLQSLGASDFMVINPGGGWMSKRWEPDNYARLLHQLEPELPWHFLLTGSPAEEPVIQEILRQAGSRRASYFPANLVQLIALERRARLFIGGDTGPLHLAAAVGTPIVAIYGPTDPARNGPFSPGDIALSNLGPIDHTRRTKHPSYLPGIAVEAVLDAVRKRLQRAYGA
ncbi:MAG: glycosyltransferase family 9 protein [Terriglobia bacterium]